MSLESLQKKYDKILNETKDITSPIIDRLTGNPSPSQVGEVSEDGIIHRPCGVSRRVPKLDPVQIDKAQRKQEEIVTQVDENPFEFPDAAQVEVEKYLQEMVQVIKESGLLCPQWVSLSGLNI